MPKAQHLDIITTLPQHIIETILCFLPTDEAARTSILSREWRYKWTTVPKLEFEEHFVYKKTSARNLKKTSSIAKDRRNTGEVFRAIHQVMLMREAPIREFTLSMEVDETCFELDQIILHLSSKHLVEKLTLNLLGSDSYNLPLSLFSMHRLIELNLDSCDLVRQPTFNGFGSLTSLSLVEVKMTSETFLHLLSNCPSLKRLYLWLYDEHMLGDGPTIMELFKCLPMIEHLTVMGDRDLYLVQDSVLSVSLIHLKYFVGNVDFGDNSGLPFLFVLIKCSPNLEKVKLEDCHSDGIHDETGPDILEKYSDVWLEHLIEVEIECIHNSKRVMEFVTFILVRSPNLKKVILGHLWVDKNEELKMLEVLSRAPHLSPVKFIVENPS